MNEINTHLVKKTLFLILCLLVNHGALAQYENRGDFRELSVSLHQEFAKDFAFSALVEIDNIKVFSENFGFIDKKKMKPVNEKTLFNVASISKSITAVGIMRLVEQDKIRLSDTLGQFFENVPYPKKSISISTLLSHKSGLRQTYPLDGISESNEALQTILNEKLEFNPESGFRYSNQNYQLLALIIEKITKNTFEKFIREEVLLPLKMDDTYFWHEVNKQQNVADYDTSMLRRIATRNWGWIGGVGVFSTTTDLLKFWNGIYDNGFLSNKSIGILFNTYYQTTSGTQIGYGFFKSPNTKWNTKELWTRGSESWGHNGVIRFFPKKNTTIIVVTNSGEIGNNRNMTGNMIISDLIADHLFK